MLPHRLIYFISTVIFLHTSLHAQEMKIEKEHRVEEELVPAEAREWMAATFPQIKKVKWYQEQSSRYGMAEMQNSFEAKFKFNGHLTSVEFSAQGEVEDVEINRSLRELDSPSRNNLNRKFRSFSKFKLIKLQEQWSGPDSDGLKEAILQNDFNKATIRYEVEFKALWEGKHTLWEGLFDQEGELLLIREIQLRPVDNLDL